MATTERRTLAVVSHALVQETSQQRWRSLAEAFGWDVHLLVPRRWESTWFGDTVEFKPREVRENRFHVHPLATSSVRNWNRYWFVSHDAQLRQIRPDLIYIVHQELAWIHEQIYLYRRLWAQRARIIFFSMNGLGVPTDRFHQRWRWRRLLNNTDAALVHFPGCMRSLREAGYSKPIYLQTQIGVDERLFGPDAESRERVRRELGFEQKLVIGYAGRLTEDKGVGDLLDIFPLEGIDWALLLVGDGPLRASIEERARAQGWQDRVHVTGFVEQTGVPDFMNAMDVFVLASRTTPHWIDTFPLVTVQAQACGVPVVGSDSASIPWQLGNSALVYPEGDVVALKESVMRYAREPALRAAMAQKGLARSRAYFCTSGLAENFDKIARQVLEESFVFQGPEAEYVQWKAYR